MRKLLLLPAALTAVLASTAGAHASSYTLTISGSDTGSVIVSSNGSGANIAGVDAGAIHLTSGSGTIDGNAVTLVAAPIGSSNASNAGFDGDVHPASNPPIDASGLEFTFGTGGIYFVFADPQFGFGIFGMVNGVRFQDTSGDHFVATPLATTPEPSSMVLLGTGLLGLAGAARRKFAPVA